MKKGYRFTRKRKKKGNFENDVVQGAIPGLTGKMKKAINKQKIEQRDKTQETG